MVFDHAGKYLYITTSDGFVLPYNLTTHQLEAGYNLGGSLNGIDIAPDDSFLLVAQNYILRSGGTVHRIDLSSGATTNVDFERGPQGDGGAWDVAIAGNGLGFVTTQFSGSGPTTLRQIDLATNTVTIRSDVPRRDGTIAQNTRLYRNGSGTRLCCAGALAFTYDATTNAFGPAAAHGGGGAVDRTGALVATGFYKYCALDAAPNFNFVRSLHGIDQGAVFAANSDTLYGVDGAAKQIIAYDTRTFAEMLRLDIGPELGDIFQPRFATFIASPDGRYLALETVSGIQVFAVTDGRAGNTIVPTLATRRGMVFDHAGQYLYLSTADGLLESYRISNGELAIVANLGGSLDGIDISSDDSFLLVAQEDVGISQWVYLN